jgi:PhnB protein
VKVANPYLNFPGHTEEAFTYYRSIFGGEFTNVTRFRDMGGNEMGIPESDLDRIANIGLPLGPNNLLMGTDTVTGWAPITMGTNYYIALETDTAEEAQRVFSALGQGGTIEMAMQPTAWAEQYGSLKDRYGVQWMVMYTGAVQFG